MVIASSNIRNNVCYFMHNIILSILKTTGFFLSAVGLMLTAVFINSLRPHIQKMAGPSFAQFLFTKPS